MKTAIACLGLLAAALAAQDGADLPWPRMWIEIADHTSPAAVDGSPALLALRLPAGAIERAVVAKRFGSGEARTLALGRVSGDRCLWVIELVRPLSAQEHVTLYVDTDNDTRTGRRDMPGVDLMLQASLERLRVKQWGIDGRWLPNGYGSMAVVGPKVYITYDYPLATSVRVVVSTPGGAAPAATVPVPAPLGIPLTIERDSLSRERSSAGGAVQVLATLEAHERYDAWRVRLRNAGPQPKWLDVRLSVRLRVPSQWRFWDGFNLKSYENPATAIRYDGISAAFPLCAAWGDRGRALGQDPWDLTSRLSCGVEPNPDGWRLWRSTRLVVAPGGEQFVRFVAMRFDAAFGWRSAVSSYWDAFPEAFHKADDIDPRFHKGASAGLYWKFPDSTDPRHASDLVRRFDCGWEWGYAPAPRPGDWAITDRSVGSWAYKGGKGSKVQTAASLAECRTRLARRLSPALADVAVAYYMHLNWCEEILARKHFADSYVLSVAGSGPVREFPYYNRTPCLRLCPYENSYDQYIGFAVPHIARTFAPDGFGFDSVFGAPRHYAPPARAPGYAFEDGRSFVCEGVAFAKQMERVRRQRVRGRRSAVVTNLKLPTLFCDAVRTDTALYEAHPTSTPAYFERILRLRLLAGQKTIVWWQAYNPRLFKWIPWDQLTPAETRDALRRLRDDLLLNSLMYGGIPCARFLSGVPKLVRAVPMLTGLSALGWQPIVPAQADERLVVSRYGWGLGQCYALVNQTYDDIRTTFVCRRPAGAVFCRYDGDAVRTQVSGDRSRVEVIVPRRGAAVLRAVASLRSSVPLDVTVEWPLEPGVPSRLDVRVRATGDGRVRGRLHVLPHHHLASVVVNGRATAVPSRAEFETTRADDVRVQAEFVPDVRFLCSVDQVRAFRFVHEGRPACRLAHSSTGELDARRIGEHFRYYYRWAVRNPADLRLPREPLADDVRPGTVVLALREELPERLRPAEEARGGVGMCDGILVVTGRDGQGLHEAADLLLRLLDQAHPFDGRFFGSVYFYGDPDKEAACIRKAGLAGGTIEGEDTGSLAGKLKLPVVPYFR